MRKRKGYRCSGSLPDRILLSVEAPSSVRGIPLDAHLYRYWMGAEIPIWVRSSWRTMWQGQAIAITGTNGRRLQLC
ncbi:MAG: hypothetical protein ACLUD2_14435 [Clostridium sp.]